MDICCDIFSEIDLGVKFQCSILKTVMVENNFVYRKRDLSMCIIKFFLPETLLIMYNYY